MLHLSIPRSVHNNIDCVKHSANEEPTSMHTEHIHRERLLVDAHRSHRTSLYAASSALSVEVKDSTNSPTRFIPLLACLLLFFVLGRLRRYLAVIFQALGADVICLFLTLLKYFYYILCTFCLCCARERDSGSEIINLFTFFAFFRLLHTEISVVALFYVHQCIRGVDLAGARDRRL